MNVNEQISKSTLPYSMHKHELGDWDGHIHTIMYKVDN